LKSNSPFDPFTAYISLLCLEHLLFNLSQVIARRWRLTPCPR
jgi:hypothetical protein